MITELDCTLDFVTVTASEASYAQMKRAADLLIYGGDRAVKTKPWRFLRYHGRRVDTDSGGAAYGVNLQTQASIIQAWGDYAPRTSLYVNTDMCRPTRADYAVSVLHDEEQPPFDADLPRLRQYDINYTVVQPAHSGGGTLYVGHRASDQFGRIYDKGAQLGLRPYLYYRYEVEYKRACAVDAYRYYLEAENNDERRLIILSNVERFFQHNHIPVPFSQYDQEPCRSIVRYQTRVSDNYRTLTWLSEQVRPAIMRLRHGDVEAEQIAQALGVADITLMSEKELTITYDARQLELWPRLDI